MNKNNLTIGSLCALGCEVLYGIYYSGETFGISSTTASESGVFLACIPVASLTAYTLMLKKKHAKLQVAGILITLSGVVLTVLAVGASSSLSISGYAFLLKESF